MGIYIVSAIVVAALLYVAADYLYHTCIKHLNDTISALRTQNNLLTTRFRVTNNKLKSEQTAHRLTGDALKKYKHDYDTVRGLWATDRPNLIGDKFKSAFFRIGYPKRATAHSVPLTGAELEYIGSASDAQSMHQSTVIPVDKQVIIIEKQLSNFDTLLHKLAYLTEFFDKDAQFSRAATAIVRANLARESK